MKVLLTHPPEFRRQYYGERSLNGLRAVAEVKLHHGAEPLDTSALVEARRRRSISSLIEASFSM